MDFIKNIVKTILKAVFSACIVNLIVLFLIIYILSSSANKVINGSKQKLKLGSTLLVDTSMQLSDIALSSRSDIIVSDYAKMSLLELYERILSAAKDPNVDAIYLYNSKAKYNFNLSQSLAIKKALASFKESGKKVYSYLGCQSVSQNEYFLSSVSNEIWINPQSIIDFSGIAFNGTFFGSAFEKYGIEATVVKCGENKSFGDMFTKAEFAPETKADLELIAKDLESYISLSSFALRDISMDIFKEIKDISPMISSKKSLELNLVDKIVYKDEADKFLSEATPDYNPINVRNYTPNYKLNKAKSDNNIAIVYMTGSIVEFANSSNSIASSKYCKIIKDIAKDDSIKAVLFVINSSGGSAYASEQIRHEIQVLSEKKKSIAYVTSMCASGAYWIATACNKIYAQETSLVGSIGVFSILFDVQKLSSDFGVTFDSAKSSKYADIFSPYKKASPEEISIMQTQVDEIYNNFVSLVSDSRSIDANVVKNEIATGSIWTSQQAKKLGLIDSDDNNLPDTIRVLAKKLNIEDTDYSILTYPEPKTYEEFFSELFTGESSMRSKVLSYIFPHHSKTEYFLNSFDSNTNIFLHAPFLLEEF